MNSDFLAQLDYLGQERGISREVLLESLEKAIATAARKDFENPDNIEVKINPTTGEIKAFAIYEVVDNPSPTACQMAVDKALKINPDVKAGETVKVEMETKNLGRIAAQTARQVMLQQLRKAEKAIVHQEFKEKLDQIVSGVVRRIEAGSLVVDMQKAEGVLKKEDQIPGERYSVGDRINAVIREIESRGSGPSLILSRATPDFVKRLFEREVAEIHNGIVQIKAIAREAGSRTKIAVLSSDSHIDAIGACVGIRGMRVKNITGELSGEKIDIVKYDDDIKLYVANALQPASVKGIELDEKNKALLIRVASDQFALALGKKGQNLRLTSRLVGWKIDIAETKEDIPFEEKLAQAVEMLARQLQVGNEIAGKLAKNGYLTVDGVLAADQSDLEKIEGIERNELDAVLESIKKIRNSEKIIN